MTHRRGISALLLALGVLTPAVGRAQTGDGIGATYERLYAGDPEGAAAAFTHARDGARDALPPWFGELFSRLQNVAVDESLETAYERDLDAFIAQAEARYGRSRSDAEAQFYLAHSYLLRCSYRFLTDKGAWGAARDAAKARGYAEDYVRQHPEHGDAYLPLGIYNYYVGIAPTFFKLLRVLLFMPSGDRDEGLKQLERAARDGNLMAPLAQGLLAAIYGSVEGRLSNAIDIGERLARRFPQNSMIRLQLGDLYAHPTVDAYARAEIEYRSVIDAPVEAASIRQASEHYRATMGLATLRRSEWRLGEAIALLNPVIEQKPARPKWVVPAFLLQRANYRMLANDTGAANDARQVGGTTGMAKFHDEAKQQLRQIEAWRRRPDDAALYASLIPGNRLVAIEKWDEAKAEYARVAADHPNDPQIRYRLAVLDFERRDYTSAARALEQLSSSSARMPDWLRATTLLYLAWTHDLAGRRADALRLYKRIVDDYDDETASGPAKIGLLSPYAGPIKKP